MTITENARKEFLEGLTAEQMTIFTAMVQAERAKASGLREIKAASESGGVCLYFEGFSFPVTMFKKQLRALQNGDLDQVIAFVDKYDDCLAERKADKSWKPRLLANSEIPRTMTKAERAKASAEAAASASDAEGEPEAQTTSVSIMAKAMAAELDKAS